MYAVVAVGLFVRWDSPCMSLWESTRACLFGRSRIIVLEVADWLQDFILCIHSQLITLHSRWGFTNAMTDWLAEWCVKQRRRNSWKELRSDYIVHIATHFRPPTHSLWRNAMFIFSCHSKTDQHKCYASHRRKAIDINPISQSYSSYCIDIIALTNSTLRE